MRYEVKILSSLNSNRAEEILVSRAGAQPPASGEVTVM